MKKIWIAGVAAMMILGLGMQADAGFNLGGIANRAANKAANKAMDSILSGGKKQSTEKAKPTTKTKSTAPANSKGEETFTTKDGVVIHRYKVDLGAAPTAFVGELDPLPPAEFADRPAWYDNRTQPYTMTNARLVAELENINRWRSQHDDWVEPDMVRHDELVDEIRHRRQALGRYMNYVEWEKWDSALKFATENDTYKRTVGSNVEPLYRYAGEEAENTAVLKGYHPEIN